MKAMRWIAAAAVVAVLAVVAWLLWPRPTASPSPESTAPAVETAIRLRTLPRPPALTSCTSRAPPLHYILETMGSGVGWIDYDADGLPDLFCVQGGPIKPDPSVKSRPTSRLYRNKGDRTFEDVTTRSALTNRAMALVRRR
jgi:hypothetical protein